MRVSQILTTHGHADHVQALKPVRDQTHARFTCHEADESMMPIKADHRVHDGERFRFGEYELVALHTPGHTPGSICLLSGEHLFSGDTLFPVGPGNKFNPYSCFPKIIERIRGKRLTIPEQPQVHMDCGS